MSEPITFVIINWNLKQDTADCIESLITAGAKKEDIIVVDNGSTDESVTFLKEKYGPALTVLALKENMGFAKGSNAGIQYAMDNGAFWIFLMNNDTVVAPDFVEHLQNAIGQGKNKYMLYNPLILYFSEPDIIWYLSDLLIPGTMIGRNPYFKKNVKNYTFPDLLPSDFVNGCGMLVHREVYEKAGMMDTSLFIYHEEVDFCWRARRAGFNIASAPKARMWHKISSIMGKQKPKTRYLQTRNQIWVYRRYSKGLLTVLMFAFTLFRFMRLVVTDIRMKQLNLFPYMWQGFWEGWTANPHQGEY